MCPGDSGGPLILFNASSKAFTQIGVVFGGVFSTKCEYKYPGIFVPLQKYEVLTFIQEEIRLESFTTTTTSLRTTLTTTSKITVEPRL